MESKEITALTLINTVVDFTSMVPDSTEWIIEKHKNNPSRYIRLKQLHVLFNIFLTDYYSLNDFQTSMRSVFNGDFLSIRKLDAYQPIIKKMDEAILTANGSNNKKHKWTITQLQFNYERLMEFKINASKLLSFNSGIIEISYPYFYSCIVTDNLLKTIKLKTLDTFLASVIDPVERFFNKEELVKKFNYPKEDIYDVDLENW